MALYEYRCEDCMHRWSQFLPSEDRDTARCPSCDERADRMFSLPHAAPIGGIYNKVNRHWNEDGKEITDRSIAEKYTKAIGHVPAEVSSQLET